MINRKSLFGLLLSIPLVIVGYQHWNESSIAGRGLQKVANGDAQFWLMQGEPNNRYIPCTVYYNFDVPLNETQLRERLKELVASYAMFQRNVVEVQGLPYWQSVETDWSQNFRVLDVNEDMESVRAQAEAEVSQPSKWGEGLPLFRAYLSADRKKLVFVWHHVISDIEGMFNKHAKHLFKQVGERTQFGYQLSNGREEGQSQQDDAQKTERKGNLLDVLKNINKPLGVTKANYEVTKAVLPVKDKTLHSLGQKAGLPMSDIFSFITLRAVTHYEDALAQKGDKNHLEVIRPLVSPISLRKNSLATDEGNNRAIRTFPFVFPLESLPAMHQRIINLEATSNSYETAGRVMKIARQVPLIEPTLRSITMPDYISNYFPLADMPLKIGNAQLLSHDLRVPMVPYERTKFAWSHYNGKVNLYLHTDTLLVQKQLMLNAFQQSSKEVLQFLNKNMETDIIPSLNNGNRIYGGE